MGSAWEKEGPKKLGTPGEWVTTGAEGYHAKEGVGYSRKIGEGVIAKEDEGMVPAKEDGMGWGWRKGIPPVKVTKKNVTTNCTTLQEIMIIV